jgi:hypothetical protein
VRLVGADTYSPDGDLNCLLQDDGSLVGERTAKVVESAATMPVHLTRRLSDRRQECTRQ